MASQKRAVFFGVLIATLVLTTWVGCDVQTTPSAPSADNPQPPRPPAPVLQNAPRSEPADATGQRQGATGADGSAPSMIARLSAGTALPQLLPEGTAMGMSVDYVLQDALPTSAVSTVWVIESAQGADADVPVRLSTQGNLTTFVTSMKPEQGPFQSYLAIVLADGSRVPISARIEMESP